MATVSAWDLGYISAGECLTRLERIVETLHEAPADIAGHFFNWYDTQSLVPLAPLYVSTVDSGNLLGYLLTTSNALAAIVDSDVLIDRRFQDGLSDILDSVRAGRHAGFASLGRDSARDFRADVRRHPSGRRRDPGGAGGIAATGFDRCRPKSTVLGARLHDAQDRLPARRCEGR